MMFKRVIFAVSALIIGLSSALADHPFAINAYIKVRLVGQLPGRFVCLQTMQFCVDAPAGPICAVRIIDLNLAQAFARNGSTCPTPNLVDLLDIPGVYDGDGTIIEINNN